MNDPRSDDDAPGAPGVPGAPGAHSAPPAADAAARLQVAEHRNQMLLKRVAELLREREQFDGALRHRQAQLDGARRTLQAARRHLQVAEAAQVALWEWDIPAGTVSLGSRWDEMLGETPGARSWRIEELLALVHRDDLPRLRQAIDEVLAGREPRYRAEHRVKARDGWIWIESVGLITDRDPQGRARRVTGFNSDITARRQMHADMAHAREQAEASNQAKSEFLANMSHEVRTPLNAVMGLTRLLYQSPLNTEQREYLELIDSSATSLLALLNDVLDLSKIEAGKLVFEQVRFDLDSWVREAVALHTPAAQKKGLAVQVSVDRAVPPKVLGDPGRLRQVISNLMANAVKFTPHGRVRVAVRPAEDTQGLAPGQHRLLFAVRDSGVGIAPDKQRQIFESFTQADASVTRRYGGTGLGLAICARLVQMMGGQLGVKSRPGEGSEFFFTAVFDDAPDEMSVMTEPAPLDAPPTHSLHVLLAEDHAVNELLMRRLLSQMGCKVVVASNGEEALREWRNQDFDVVLMDVQMPVLSGLDAVARMRAIEARDPSRVRTPVVALTAHAMAGDRERCLAAGMDAYVSKPVSPARLSQAIHEARAAVPRPAGDDVTVWPTVPVLPQAWASAPALFGPGPGARSQWDTARTLPPAAPATTAPGVSGISGVPGVPAASAPAPIDLEPLSGLFPGQDAALREFAEALRDDLHMRRPLLQQAMQERAQPRALEQVHSIKGGLSAFGAPRAMAASRDAEAALRAGDWAAAGAAVGRLLEEMAAIEAALAQQFG